MTKQINSILLILVVIICGCSNQTKNKDGLKKEDFEKIIDGEKISLWTLANKNGLEMSVTNFGARVVSLMVPDKKNDFRDIVLGFSNIEEYEKLKPPYYGAIVGRYANRISKGKFTIDGNEYLLATNNGNNHIHGGIKGFNAVAWDVVEATDQKLVMSYLSKDGEEGYPGNLKVKMIYELTDDNEFKINYVAETDKKTVINFTHHSFFNFHGEGMGPILDHLLYINADNYAPTNVESIPTGEIAPVKGTPMDFSVSRTIGSRIDDDFEALKIGKGYDHCYVLNKTANELSLAARVVEPKSGISMEVWTTEPGIQIYTGNYQKGSVKGKNGRKHNFRGAFCLETQHFPDSPNQPDFPSTILEPGNTYRSTCIYKFGVE